MKKIILASICLLCELSLSAITQEEFKKEFIAGNPEIDSIFFATSSDKIIGVTIHNKVPIKDFSILKKVPKLNRLQINLMSGMDVSVLSKLNLDYLTLNMMDEYSLSVLAYFKKVKDLRITNYRGGNINFVAKMRSLEKLAVKHCRNVCDFSAVRNSNISTNRIS